MATIPDGGVETKQLTTVRGEIQQRNARCLEGGGDSRIMYKTRRENSRKRIHNKDQLVYRV